MKEWDMIHKIKALYDNGKGSSIRSIAKELGISRNTVRKYLRMDESAITKVQEERSRHKILDEYRDYIIHLLQTYPRLSAVKVLRKLENKVGSLDVSERSVRRYIRSLRDEVVFKQRRYYEPVLDMIPGVQCQVDPGEISGIKIGGKEQPVYFVVFVLSYSRLMYVAASPRPIDTDTFIRLHDMAFRYFGGCPEECVYDQTRLVVIKETFRELELNQRFYQYATGAGFQIRACEGYDPESKGKVEAGVKYVKHNALYGESFSDWTELEEYLAVWLEKTANVRIHGTTGKVPRQVYDEEEHSAMRAYFTPLFVKDEISETPSRRKVDKTGLLSWCSNKYSVPMPYQQAIVGVEQVGENLYVTDLGTGSRIAEHVICHEKGRIIKNNNHYRDHEKHVRDFEAQVKEQLEEPLGSRICSLLKATSPQIYKDQLAGLIKILSRHDEVNLDVMEKLSRRPRLTATMIRDYLEAYSLSEETPASRPVSSDTARDLARYAKLTTANGGCYVVH
jgi:transposase